jgi:RNA polymerase sigma-70 factor (ECF subfamily)
MNSTITSVPNSTEVDPDLAARFAHETAPLFDVLRRGARRLTKSDADAEDLLQDTLLNAYAGFGTYTDGTNLKAWLFRILYNRWVSTHRSKQRRPNEVSLDVIIDPDATFAAAHRSAEAEVLDRLPDNEIRAALDGLPDGFADVVYLADVEGYTYAETAALLGIPQGTVMSRVSRGRQRLRIALAHLDHNRDAVDDLRIA